MKKCPNCQREFPDTMRFCQTDGTPLVEVVEEVQAEDPLKTQVVRQEELAEMIPSDDPFKTMVASRVDEKDDEDNVLQLPQNFDPLATMVVSPAAADPAGLEDLVADPPAFDSIKEEIRPDTPAPSFADPAPPISEPPPPTFAEPPLSEPPAPSFGEPPVPAHSFSEPSPPPADDDMPATVLQTPFQSFSEPPAPESPFTAPPPVNQPPAPESPFAAPPPVFDAPPPAPAPDTSMGFGAPQSPFAEPLQTAQPEWNPPPAPVQEWQPQQISADTPFQPPVTGQKNQTLAIASLICGIGGFLICQIAAPVAVVLGFMARKKAKENPNEFGGEGLALAGMIVGAIGTLLLLLVIAYFILVFGLAVSGSL